MSRIFLTGDTHGGAGAFSAEMKRFSAFEHIANKLSKDDYLIILGDFSFIWRDKPDNEEKRWRKYFENFAFTTLFIDGNHENFDRLNSYEISQFKGGKIHKIWDNVYHLMRGQIYDFDGRSVFTLGGAASIDREYRCEGLSWWNAENISEAELREAWENLARHNYSVDLVLSHTAPNSVANKVLTLNEFAFDFVDPNGEILEQIYRKISFKKWYFGHFHEELFCVDSRYATLWHDIIELEFDDDKIRHHCKI